jgi:fibronectin-binding autotransporter adhesin
MHLLPSFGLVLIGTTFSLVSAQAQTITTGSWQGTAASNATWDTTTTANWKTAIPVAANTVSGVSALFNGGAGVETTIPIISTGVSAAGITFGTSAPAYTFNGGALTVDVGLVQNSSKSVITDNTTNAQTFNNMVDLTDANLVAATGTVATTYVLSGAAGATLNFDGGLSLGNYVNLSVTTGTLNLTIAGPFVNSNIYTTPTLSVTGTADVLNWDASSMTSASGLYLIKNFGSGAITNIFTDPTAVVTFGGTSAVGGVFDAKTNGLYITSQLSDTGSLTGNTVLEVNTSSAGAVTWAGAIALPKSSAAGNNIFQIDVANANNALAISAPVTTGSATLAVQLTGPGTVVMDALNTYTAASTTIQSGTLVLQAGTTSTTAYGLGGSTGTVVVDAGAGLEFANTITTGTSNLNIASLVVNGGAGTTLGGSIGSTLTGDAIKVTGTATVTGSSLGINIYGISGVAPATGTYTLISGGSGSTLNGATSTSIGNVYNASNFTVGPLTTASGSITVGITSQAAQASEYWVGGYSGGNSVWSISNGTTTSNWSASATADVATSLTPGATTTIFFNGLNTFNNAVSTTLGADMSVAGIVVSDAQGVGLNGDGHTLTIGAGGVTVNTGSGSVTLGSMISDGSNSETWTNNSSNVLTIVGETSILNNSIISIDGSGGVIFNGLTVSGGLTLDAGAGSVTVNGAVINNNTEFALTNNSSSVATINGQIEMGTSATGGFLVVNGTGNSVINGPISGSNTVNAFGAGVYKMGTGTLTLSAKSANVYLGSTIIAAGEVDLGDTGGVAIPGALTIGTDAGSPSEVKLLASNQTSTTTALGIHSDGTFALNGFNTTVASLTSYAGTIIGSGTLTTTAGPVFTGINSSTANDIGAGATVASTAQASLAAGDSLEVDGSLADSAGLNMANGSSTSVSGGGSITGPVTMNGGGDSISGTGSGLSTGGIIVNGTGNSLASGTVGGPVTINGSFAVNGTATGPVNVTSTGGLTGTGTIKPTVSSGYGVTVAAGGNITPGGTQPAANYNYMANGGKGPSNPAAGNLTLDPTNVAGGSLLSVAASATITSPALTFALGNTVSGSVVTASSSQILVGGTAANILNFNVGGTSGVGGTSSVVSINDLVGASLQLNTEYVLIAGNGSTTFEDNGFSLAAAGDLGQMTALGQRILGGMTLLAPNGSNFFSTWYNGSELFLNGDSIEVDVVPEPSTWALMLGGLATLVVIMRRRNKARDLR